MAGIAALLLMALMLNDGDANISIPSVNCLLINLEYLNCTWIAQGIQEVNYTFHSLMMTMKCKQAPNHHSAARHGVDVDGSLKNGTYRECPTYLLQNGITVGCRLLYTGLKFHKLHTRLSRDNSSPGLDQIHDLTHEVKLDPPHHLRLEVKEGESNPELWLRWRVSCPSSCVESEVRYRKHASVRWEVTLPIAGYSFIPPFFSPDDMYEFQVRVRVPDLCAQSKYWSDWSTAVVWGSKLRSNSAGFYLWRLGSAVYWLPAVVVALIG